MDGECLSLVARFLPEGFDPDLEAVLIVERDGERDDLVRADLEESIRILAPVVSRLAGSPEEREALWNTRRSVGQVLGNEPRNIFSEDIVVPIARIPEMVRRVRRVAEATGFKIIVAGHAGDGNLHPVILVDGGDRSQVSAVAAQIFRDAVELGGSISAEHGLGGVERELAELEHGPAALDVMRRLKRELDPQGLLNPDKVFPLAPADDDFLNRLPGWLEPDATPVPGAGPLRDAAPDPAS
jgi:glycolate oxidase